MKRKGLKSFLVALFAPKLVDKKLLRSFKRNDKKAEQRIKKLPPELKKIAQVYLDEGYGPVVSLKQVNCFLEIKKQNKEVQAEAEELVKKYFLYSVVWHFIKET